MIILLKTDGSTINQVVEHEMHALHERPTRLCVGTLILISQTEESLRPDELPIRYSMEYERYYEDTRFESDRIFGRHWRFIIQCRNCRRLVRPFRMSEVQISGTRYAQGGTIWNVDREDERYLRENGYLATVDEHTI